MIKSKKYFIYLLLIAFISCKAQTHLAAINEGFNNAPAGTYFSDIENEMNKFVGTWQYAIANESLTIVLQKKTMVPYKAFFEDLLVGEYEYILSGTTVVNTLHLLNNTSIPVVEHNIIGRRIVPNNAQPICTDCNSSDRRFKLYFFDSERDYLRSVRITLQYITNSSPSQIKVTIAAEDGTILPHENAPTVTRVPYGDYIMTKQ